MPSSGRMRVWCVIWIMFINSRWALCFWLGREQSSQMVMSHGSSACPSDVSDDEGKA